MFVGTKKLDVSAAVALFAQEAVLTLVAQLELNAFVDQDALLTLFAHDAVFTLVAQLAEFALTAFVAQLALFTLFAQEAVFTFVAQLALSALLDQDALFTLFAQLLVPSKLPVNERAITSPLALIAIDCPLELALTLITRPYALPVNTVDSIVTATLDCVVAVDATYKLDEDDPIKLPDATFSIILTVLFANILLELNVVAFNVETV